PSTTTTVNQGNHDGEDEDEEDDYMSAAFLTDPTPASSSSSSAASPATYSQRRKLALQAQSRPPPGSAQSIQEKRNEGLKRKLDESNKGMSLLQKMGWKEGAALGKTNPGILEPLAPTLHRGRLGIGVKSVQEEQEEAEAKRIRLLQGKEDQFRDWRATKFTERQIENDIRKARKICFQLDSASDESDTSDQPLVEAPLRPLEPLPDLASYDDTAPAPDCAANPDEIEPWTAESKAFEALEPSEQLAQLISTLRERTHIELQDVCPGLTRDDH
ncbi:hypothetical protein BCR44DRAFT_1437032, partial [Catenaria anguillulae PL171]